MWEFVAEDERREGGDQIYIADEPVSGGSPAPNNEWIIQEAAPSLNPYGIVLDWQTWDQYFDRVDKNRSSVNFAFMVGATQVRQFVMKNEMRDPSAAELAAMQEQVRIAMKSGVFGVSTSLLYAPASYSKTDEIVALAKVASEYGGFYASHIRNEADRLLEALDEAIEIGGKANCPVQIWHLKASGKQNFSKMKDALQKIADARAQGIDMTADIYPYPAGATSLAASLPKWALEGGTNTMLKRLADSTTREKIKKEMMTSFPETDNIFLDADSGKRIMIASAQKPALKKYVGKMLEDIAKDHCADEPETLCWFVEQDQGATGAIYFTQSEEEMQKAMKAPFVAFNCDYPGMATDGILVRDHPHPRAYGTFPRILARYVREKNVMSLEEAIRKMTSLPAQRLGLQKRGILKEGNYADITVFDFNGVRDVATFEDPSHYSEGIIYVFVNGRPVLAKGAITEKLPGRILLRGQNN
ncbi:amidohydrolase family protein [bacterium]|nr:amidohydrolase family protein [bacterium]